MVAKAARWFDSSTFRQIFIRVTSSTGRALVSKTKGSGFDSLVARQFLLAPSSIGRAPDFDSGGSWFETKGVCHLHAALAQLEKSTTLRTSRSGVRISRAAPQKDFGLRAALATATDCKSVLLRDTTGFDSLAIHQNDVPR